MAGATPAPSAAAAHAAVSLGKTLNAALGYAVARAAAGRCRCPDPCRWGRRAMAIASGGPVNRADGAATSRTGNAGPARRATVVGVGGQVGPERDVGEPVGRAARASRRRSRPRTTSRSCPSCGLPNASTSGVAMNSAIVLVRRAAGAAPAHRGRREPRLRRRRRGSTIWDAIDSRRLPPSVRVIVLPSRTISWSSRWVRSDGDRLGDRRLADAQHVGGGADRAEPCHEDKRAELCERHDSHTGTVRDHIASSGSQPA